MVYENFSALIEALSSALEDGEDIAALLLESQSALSAEELSLLLEAFPPEQRLAVWLQLNAEIQQQTFLEMRDESRKLLLNLLDDEQCFPLFEKLSAEELLDLVEALSDRFIDYALSKMSSKQRGLYEKAKNYDDESVGHWQSFDALRIPQRMTVARAKRLCRKALRLLPMLFMLSTIATGCLVNCLFDNWF